MKNNNEWIKLPENEKIIYEEIPHVDAQIKNIPIAFIIHMSFLN